MMFLVQQLPFHHVKISIRGMVVLLFVGLMTTGCIEHRTVISPPLPADPPATGETPAATVLMAGSRFQNEPNHPEVFTSPLPLDIPASVYRRESDGTIARGELRLTTDLRWWQRFPVDAFVDFAPFDATIDATDIATLTPVKPFDRVAFLKQATTDGYARTAAPIKPKP
jgi:hypothetical protein